MTNFKVKEKFDIKNTNFDTIQELYETLEDFLFVQKDKEKNIDFNLSKEDWKNLIFWNV